MLDIKISQIAQELVKSGGHQYGGVHPSPKISNPPPPKKKKKGAKNNGTAKKLVAQLLSSRKVFFQCKTSGKDG
jgi:hypothetical protein